MDIYSLYQKLQKDNFSLIYLGEFDDDLTSVLMRIQETSSEEERQVKKRMSYLIAECFQNIIRHSDHDEEVVTGSSKFFMMRSIESMHFLATANPIENANRETLIKSLESLQNLSEAELKDIYLNALGTNEMNAKGGGGLGLIEMARKTKNPPSYKFDYINELYSNFFMQLKMQGGKDSIHDILIEDTIDLYHQMQKDHIVLVRKGDFSQESILPLFKLFESNLQIKKEDLVFKKKSLYILIELLENMNRHAVEFKGSKEGVFIVALENGVYTMKTGNFVEKSKAIILKKHLESLINLDKDGLSKRYKEQILDVTVNDSQGAGIGIIEMMRQSDGDINFEFDKVSDELCFYSFSATL